jgi:hypothetical protein
MSAFNLFISWYGNIKLALRASEEVLNIRIVRLGYKTT